MEHNAYYSFNTQLIKFDALRPVAHGGKKMTKQMNDAALATWKVVTGRQDVDREDVCIH